MNAINELQSIREQYQDISAKLAELKQAEKEAGKRASREKVTELLEAKARAVKAMGRVREAFTDMSACVDEIQEMANYTQALTDAGVEGFDMVMLTDTSVISGNWGKFLDFMSKKKSHSNNPVME